MQPTTRLLARGPFPSFWRRSLDEFRKQANFGRRLTTQRAALTATDYWLTIGAAIKLEALEKPKQSLDMWTFSDSDSIAGCSDMSDSDIGGFSSVSIDHIPQSSSDPSHLLFTGNISNKLPSGEKDVERTGYAAFRTRDRPATMFGKALWNVDRYKYLALRVKTDDRKYKVNLQTESVVYTDIHQHRLYAKRPGRWETVLIKWNDFVRTNHGIVVEPQSEIMKEKVRTVGIGLTDRLPGTFQMGVSRIWACNGLTAEELQEAEQDEARYVPRHFLGVATEQLAKERI